MSAKIYCLCASLFGASVGACLPAASGSEEANVQAESPTMAADAPLEIAISQFPQAYQGRWAMTRAGCDEDPETSVNAMSLQGKLVKFHESIGTMTEGKRETARSMQANFEFVGEEEKWNKSIAFELDENRKELTRTDRDSGASYRYVQCPKLMAG